jgi:hypothetical protein
LQEIDKGCRYNLFHIDEHTDALSSRLEEWKARLPDLWDIGIDDYLALECGGDSAGFPLIRWDNYLSLFLDVFARNVGTTYFATRRGDEPRWENRRKPDFWDIPENLENWLEDSSGEWIVNVDLDFFYCDIEGLRQRMYSPQYERAVFSAIARQIQSGRIRVLTLCISPDDSLTGGWSSVEELCGEVCEVLGAPFALP